MSRKKCLSIIFLRDGYNTRLYIQIFLSTMPYLRQIFHFFSFMSHTKYILYSILFFLITFIKFLRKVVILKLSFFYYIKQFFCKYQHIFKSKIKWQQKAILSETLIMILLSCVIGTTVGFAAIGFYILVDVCKFFFLDLCAGYRPVVGASGEVHIFGHSTTQYTRYMLLLLPSLGGFISGLLVYWFAPEAKGHGTDGVIEAFHRKGGKIRPIVPIVKAFASALTIGSGGSAGKEGPISQIGGGLASVISQFLRLPRRQVRILLMAGMAAGVGAIFRAPLAAAILSAEILYKEIDFEEDVIIPSILSSIIAYAVFAAILGDKPLFSTPELHFNSLWELLPYTILALFVALGARIFIWLFYAVQRIFENVRMPAYLKPTLGGILTGMIGFLLPETLSEGYGFIQRALNNETLGWMLLAVAIGKMLTTSFTLSSGGSGGVFGPAIVIGGCLGGTIGFICNTYFPTFIHLPLGAFVLVGMAGFFSASARTPISTIIMISEITGNYHLLVPSMWVCILAFIANRNSTLFSKQLCNRFDSPAKMSEIMEQVLAHITIADAHLYQIHNRRKVCTILQDQPLADALQMLRETRQNYCPLVSLEGKYLGILDPEETRQLLHTGIPKESMIAADLLIEIPSLQLNHTLHSAIDLMTKTQLDELVITEQGKPIGTISRYDIIDCYDRQMKKDMSSTTRIIRASMIPSLATDEKILTELASQTIPSLQASRDKITALPVLDSKNNNTQNSPINIAQNSLAPSNIAQANGTIYAGSNVILIYDVNANTKEQLFREMITQLNLRNPNEKENFIQELVKREAIHSTAVGQGIAIPHPRHHRFTTLGAHTAIAVLKQPLAFDTPDLQPVDIVCLVVYDNPVMYLETVKNLMTKFHDHNLATKLRARATPQEVLSIFNL